MSTYAEYQTEAPVIKPFGTTEGLPLTGKDILGPFYRPGSPFRHSIINKLDVSLIKLSGRVLDSNGNPIVGAYVDFWQADENGKYDEFGDDYRGIQQVKPDGSYRLLTIRPGFYDISQPNDPEPHQYRCSHIHAKVWVKGRCVLTTQLYFSDDSHNQTDKWFDESRVIQAGTGRAEGMFFFDFVVDPEQSS